MKIIPGIHQLKLPLKDNPLEYINAYLIQGSEGWVLIDTGWNDEESFEALSTHLKELGLDFPDISLIVPTHIHPDHFGLAGRVKQLSKAELAMSEVEKEFIDSAELWAPSVMQEMNNWLYINGVPEDYLPEFNDISAESLKLVMPCKPDRGLRDGEIISTGIFDLQVICTPGHSPGHICLYEPTHRILFSGDHILPVTTPNISIHMESLGNPLGDFFESLQKIKHLDMAIGLPAHEDIFTDLPKRIEELFTHHEARKSEILQTLASRSKTAYQVSSGITWMEGQVTWEELPPMHQRIAVTESLAHLEVLNGEGKVQKFTEKDIVFYNLI